MNGGIGLCILREALFEELILENQHIDHRNRDIGIGKVEYGAEEVSLRVKEERHPLRMVAPLKEWEVEHVHNFTHHKWGVRAAKLCDCCRCRGRENQAIECAVEDVAESTRNDECQADKYACWRLLTNECVGVVAQTANKHYAKE